MSTILRMTCAVWTCAALAGCGAAPGEIYDGASQEPNRADRGAAERDTQEERVLRLEQDFGGPEGLMQFFEISSEQEIRGTLEQYGMGYEVETRAITDCPQYFPASDRSKWHQVTGEYYYIDGSGRPSRAYTYLPPINSEARNETCQGNVGRWGDAENPSNDYDGGHMIGSQLGGYGKRANLVPQDANFNRGNWATLENKMATCAGLPNGRFYYSISVSYSNSTKLVPSNFGMYISNRATGSNVSLSFSNIDYGGSGGTSEKNRGVSFLSNNGCN
jgi:hypothetical protein